MSEIWQTLQNLTTLYLLLFVVGTYSLTNFTSNANIYLQYYVIKLTSLQAGIDTMTTYLALVFAIWLFQTYLIRKNWRWTQYGSSLLCATMGLVWIAPYYNAGGTMNPWFTIFIDVDQVGRKIMSGCYRCQQLLVLSLSHWGLVKCCTRWR
jgi:hypothetical protein